METVSRYLLTFLLNALWQIPIVAVISAPVRRLMRSGPASHRHAICVTALAACLVLPMASIRTSQRGPSMELTVAYAPQPAAAMPAHTSGANAAPARTPKPDYWTVLFPRDFAAVILWAYVLFLAFRCAMLLRAWLRTAQIRNSAATRPAPPAIERVWTRCLSVFGLHRGAIEI